MVTGKQFKAIRQFNKIYQHTLAGFLPNRPTRQTLGNMENADDGNARMPDSYVKVLSDMIGHKLTDEKVLNEYYDSLPVSFKKKRERKTDPGMIATAKVRDLDGNPVKL